MWKVFLILSVVVPCAKAFATPILSVSGPIDGSGVMHVDAAGVSWNNLYYNTPTALVVDGTAWNPSAQPSLNLPGPLLPDDLSSYSVNTKVISGREIANAQIINNQLQIFYADTSLGSDDYSIQVSFTPKPPSAPSPSATLHIVGMIDGTDTLEIRPSGLTWTHGFWAEPSGVTVNGTKWDTVNQPTLPDSGATAFLPAGVNLSSVVFTKDAGRDTATYQLFPDHIDVYFGDNPLGASTYDVTLSFGSAPEPAGFIILATSLPLLLRRRG